MFIHFQSAGARTSPIAVESAKGEGGIFENRSSGTILGVSENGARQIDVQNIQRDIHD
jgi:hypothetical protein